MAGSSSRAPKVRQAGRTQRRRASPLQRSLQGRITLDSSSGSACGECFWPSQAVMSIPCLCREVSIDRLLLQNGTLRCGAYLVPSLSLEPGFT